MKFLEITPACSDDVFLIPIKNINYIRGYGTPNGPEIKIIGDDFDLVERFTDDKKAQKRYDMIKEIIGAK